MRMLYMYVYVREYKHHIERESELHRRSLVQKVGIFLGVYSRPGHARRRRWSYTTAFAFFGEVKAVSGKFWWRPGVRSPQARIGRVTFLSPAPHSGSRDAV